MKTRLLVLLGLASVAGCNESIADELCEDLCPGTCVDGECTAAEVGAGDADVASDAAVDAEPDVAVDVGPDAEVDVEPDAEVDVEPDVEVDVEPDAEVDAEPDTELDTAPDAEVDAEPDVEPDVEPDAIAGFGIAITAPSDEFAGETGRSLTFTAEVSPGEFEPADLTAVWTSDVDGILYEANVAAADEGGGITEFSTSELSVGIHTVTLTVYSPEAELSASVDVGICGWLDAATFDEGLPEEWETYNNATRDPRGWLEMTTATRDRRGAIANVGRSIAGGDTRLRFRVATGQCDAIGPCGDTGLPGADGFALSIFEVTGISALEDIIATAGSGGGLGYGIAGGWGSYTGGDVDAFHIEFDTWHNIYNGVNEFHTDPVESNHIAITLNGDPGDHVAWAEAPTLEDNEWHDMEVIIEGAHVTVLMDDVMMIDEDVEGLDFKGGYLVFTGTTGYYYNYHRFDELQVIEDCRFE